MVARGNAFDFDKKKIIEWEENLELIQLLEIFLKMKTSPTTDDKKVKHHSHFLS